MLRFNSSYHNLSARRRNGSNYARGLSARGKMLPFTRRYEPFLQALKVQGCLQSQNPQGHLSHVSKLQAFPTRAQNVIANFPRMSVEISLELCNSVKSHICSSTAQNKGLFVKLQRGLLAPKLSFNCVLSALNFSISLCKAAGQLKLPSSAVLVGIVSPISFKCLNV